MGKKDKNEQKAFYCALCGMPIKFENLVAKVFDEDRKDFCCNVCCDKYSKYYSENNKGKKKPKMKISRNSCCCGDHDG